MITRDLPANASLESIRKQAKALLKAFKAGDGATFQRVKPYFADPHAIGLQEVQLVLAREFGFSGWTKLRAHLTGTRGGEHSAERLAKRFLSLATLSYFGEVPADPERFGEALELLHAHPEIADESIHVAAALGDAAAVGRWLDSEPQLIGYKGGPYDWEPLLYAAYARIPGRSSFEAARLLIGRGADPNAFWLDDGQYRFTALTGVFGQGEAGKERQPEHPDRRAFARLLLDAGAEPNDSQALYNCMFEPDNTCLSLLLEYGLKPSDRNNWLLREDGRLVANSERVFDYQLAWALEKRMPERVRLLVEHGADVNRIVRGRSPYEWAKLGGDDALADFLASRGARRVELSYIDRLIRAIGAERHDEAMELVCARPDLVVHVEEAHPSLLHEAAGDGRHGQVSLMLALGFNVNRMTSRTPLHEAALHGDLAMAKRLIENGADPTLRDPYHQAPPIGWAEYNGKEEMVRYLITQPLDVFAAAAFGNAERVGAMLDAQPEQLEMTFGEFRGGGRPDPRRDWMTPLAFAVAGSRKNVVKLLMGRGANLARRDPGGPSIRDLARESGDKEILDLLASTAAARR
ncbi:hypothetical protein CN074_10830 [Sinorhizobium medicae]|uniref:ankyrin repeat domain-containing protein n=1 Tax=Sinorhizobium medicae TaxID=110321 RepID=UPI000FDA1F1B|nr:ankyrin repeat domain-containing protein [Sinorhizobium medicae]MQX98540.1 hypothetical protein [Sinorhizobium medicae]RVH92313.1 hypothetical protein CN201_11475 [Sinorhizobium medicae]RVP69775.1 hypothetical protein CN074_10830 [Sinorhizobium medicae]TWA50318.1 ankyrin repeat protein [Sinorhizobium medicae]